MLQKIIQKTFLYVEKVVFLQPHLKRESCLKTLKKADVTQLVE